MLYDKYEKRVRRHFSILKQFYRFRVPILIFASFSFLFLSFYSASRGSIYSESIPETFEYNETIPFETKALFSSVSYNYRLENTTEWQEDIPRAAGNYEVLIRTTNAFGTDKTSVKSFTITAKDITLSLENSSVIFGSDISVISDDLIEGDYIDSSVFSYEDLSQTETNISLESIVIKNSSGMDVTSSYHIDNQEFSITFIPRDISINLRDVEGIYDGLTLRSRDFDIIEGSLLENHIITITASGSQTEVGSSINSILSSTVLYNNIDVSNHYNISYFDGSLEVTERTIKIDTASDSKVYDSLSLSNKDFTISEGSLVEGHEIHVLSSTEVSDVSSVTNEFEIEILDSEGKNVTSNYTISYNFGQLRVLQRDLYINTANDSKVYDGLPLSNTLFNQEGNNLIVGHELLFVSSPSIIDVGVIDNTVDVKVVDQDQTDQSNNYNIIYVYGTLEISKRSVTIETSYASKIYDGTPLSNDEVAVIEGSLIDLHSIVVNNVTSIINTGRVDNIVDVSIVNENKEDVTTNYNISYQYSSLEVFTQELILDIIDQEKVYDGLPLESNDFTIVSGQVFNNQVIVLETTGSRIEVGESSNYLSSITITEKGQDVTMNYNIIINDGSLTVRKRDITFVSLAASKVYDDLPLEEENYIISEGSLVPGQSIRIVSSTSIRNVGLVDNVIEIDIVDQEGNTSIENYNITYVYKTLEITARPIEVNGGNSIKTYDGLALTSIDYWVENAFDLVSGHRVTITTSGSQTDVGRSGNPISSVTIKRGLEDVTSNYDITVSGGMLEVLPRPITIQTIDQTKIYDTLPITSNEAKVTKGSLVLDHTLSVIANGSQTNVGSSLNPISEAFIMSGSSDVTSNYAITYEDGNLEITPYEISIKLEDKSKVYDGISLESGSVTISEGSLFIGHSIDIISSGSQVNVGISENHILSASIFDQTIDVTNNYDITYISGTLEVTKRPISIKASDQEKVYDGTVLTSNNVEFISGSIVDGQSISITTFGSQLNVGESINSIESVSIIASGIDVTFNYDITISDSNLTVTKRPITIETGSMTKVYDGLPLSNTSTSVIEGSLASGQFIEVTNEPSIINVGTISNELELLIKDENDIDQSSNYEISYVYGELEVTKRPITIESGSTTKVYDGQSLSNTFTTVTEGSLVLNHTIEVTNEPLIINVGSLANELTLFIKDENDIDQSFNYDISYSYGELEVTKRPIAIETASETKIYDAEILSNTNAILIDGSLVQGHVIEVINEVSITNVGTISNKLMVLVKDQNDIDQSSNYEISYLYGDLEVRKRAITIETGSATKVYDGLALSNSNYSITLGSLALNQVIELIDSPSITNVGLMSNELDLIIKDEFDIDQSSNYEISYLYGELEVTKRAITIETGSSSKVYDGLALSNNNYTITLGSLVPNQVVELIEHPSITNVGLMSNELELIIKDEFDIDQTSNYEIHYLYGELEITKRAITIETGSSRKVYDGLALSNSNYTITLGSLAPNQVVEVVDSPSITNVGLMSNELDLIIKDEFDINQTSNYEITYAYGSLEISKRVVTIETGSSRKVYDGLALSNSDYTVTLGSLAPNQVIEVLDSPSITNVGLMSNELELIIKDDNDIDQSSNYEISYTYGELEISKRGISIKISDKEKEYDGISLTSTDIEFVSGALVEGHTLDIMTNGSQLDIGTSLNEMTSIGVFDGTIDYTSNYDISVESGMLEVTARPITVTSLSLSKMYDGLSLTNPSLELTEGSLVSGDLINILSYSELLSIGFMDNEISFEIVSGEDINQESNYDITIVYGYLEIRKRSISISTASDVKEYDATPLERNQYELSDGSLLEGHSLDITITGSITEVGQVFNGFDFTILDSEMNDVSSFYTVIENVGTLEVTSPKIELSIISASDAKEYDASPLTNDSWTLLEGSILDNHTLHVDVTGSITEVGMTTNDMTITILDETSQDVTSLYYDIEVVLGSLTIQEVEENGVSISRGTDISTEGDLSGETGSNSPVLEVYSEKTDTIYLRDLSYGDYNKSGFDAAPIYVSPYGVSPLQFPSMAIGSSISSSEIEVKALLSGMPYYLPSYAMNGFYDNDNDIYTNHAYTSTYVIDYTSMKDFDFSTTSISDPLYQSYEEEYRSYVYDSYLDLPEDTLASMLELAERNGLSKEQDTIINDVKNYIQSAAVYNLEYKPIPEGADIARYFLEESQEGICQHFATAGVAMYRAMGIPARYVTGYLAKTVENEWSEVTLMDAHAWVEIYQDGFGWVTVEVTGGGFGGSTSQSEENTPDEINEELETITIVSGNASKHYDASPLTKETYYSTGQLASGHSIHVDFTASKLSVGETPNTFNYHIEDENGVDVTDQYNVIADYGQLKVVASSDKEILEFQLFDIKKVYSGDLIEHQNTDYWMPSNNLGANYTVTFDMIGSITTVSKISTYIDLSSIRILDENNMDVTNEFDLVTYDGSIEVVARAITVTSYSSSKAYDSTPLTSDVFYISKGSLADDQEIEVEMNASITEVGVEVNTIDSVRIVNSLGEDLTINYDVETVEGILTIYDN